MKRLLILTMLTATTVSSLGCCGMCRRFGRRNECQPYEAPCDSCEQQQACDPCSGGAGPAMMAPPGTMVMPGPATYSSSYLPR